MDFDKDDLAVLSAKMTKEEVDRVHRLLHEWGTGPVDSFPVQLTLLTRAQLLAAASVPRAIADGRKWLEQHLAAYRLETKLMLDGFSDTAGKRAADMKTTVENHAKEVHEAATQIQGQVAEAEAVAGRIKTQVEDAAYDWRNVKAQAKAQCEQLQKISNDLQDRFAWRVIIWWAVCILLAFGLGFSLAVNLFL
jgi:cell division septum initiation protein DivIVA